MFTPPRFRNYYVNLRKLSFDTLVAIRNCG
jgi:hypothetical protein